MNAANLSDDMVISLADYVQHFAGGLRKATVKRLIAKDELPAVRLSPRRLGIRVGAMRQYQKARETGAN
jgi:hypothetical protein